MKHVILSLAFSLFVFVGLSAQEKATFPSSPNDVCPLKISSTVPESAKVTSPTGKIESLSEVVDGKPTVLIFYRGGWCPFCNRHLAALQETLPELKEKGYQVIGISADSPEKLQATVDKQSLEYSLYSGADLSAFQAFGIGYELNAETVEKYKGYGIDLGASEGVLPVPAVFVLNKKGEVIFSHVDPNYKERLRANILMAVVAE